MSTFNLYCVTWLVFSKPIVCNRYLLTTYAKLHTILSFEKLVNSLLDAFRSNIFAAIQNKIDPCSYKRA